MLVEVIKQVDKTLDVINLGAEDFIVYYKRKQEESKIFLGKIVFVILVAFFGASFSIMTYNTDVGIEELFYNVYEMNAWDRHQMVQIFFIFLMQQDWRLGSFYFLIMQVRLS